MIKVATNYTLIQKNVKHARLQVNEGGKIRLIVPETFTDEDIALLLKKKKPWIEKKQHYFKSMSKVGLHRNQLLLYGNRYTYFFESPLKKNVIVDHEHHTIRSGQNLLSVEIQESWYRKIAKEYLIHRASTLSLQLDFKFNKIFIRNQKKKWGNFSSKGNISLNWRLIKAPTFVIDYLIVHELVHTVVMNHSQKFWTILKSYFPDYKDAVRWLDKYGNNL
jgi:predicted metal-dependent hydrolase